MDIFISLVVVFTIILIWVAWAEFIYKWDLDRIGNRAVKKYSQQNENKLTDSTFFAYSGVSLSNDKQRVYLTVELRDKISQTIISSEAVEYNLGECTLNNPEYFICLTF